MLCLYCRVSVVQGGYPDILLKQWDIYHAKKISENDRPGMIMTYLCNILTSWLKMFNLLGL